MIDEIEVVEAPVKTEEVMKPQAYDLSELNQSQRLTLKNGVVDAMKQSKQFDALGASQKITFYDTASMFLRAESLKMLNLKGEVHWKNVQIPGTNKKEKQRFIRFIFDYVIPGTTSSVTAVKEWRYEDFV